MSAATTEASHHNMTLLSTVGSPSSSLVEERPKPRKKDATTEVSATVCSNCGTTTTPLWRRAPDGDTICNACGLYLKARNTLRPPTLKRNGTMTGRKPEGTDCGSGETAGSCPGGGQCNGTGGSSSCAGCPAFNQHQVNRHALVCANCSTTTTPLWRRDESGSTICNACGLYYKLHGVHRPVSMKRSVIKRRKRLILSEGASDSGDLEDRDDISDGGDSRQEDQDQRSTPVKARRRRVTANKHKVHSRGKDDDDKMMDIEDQEQHQQHMDILPVPAIEDYIVPRRVQLPKVDGNTSTMPVTRPMPVSQGSIGSHPSQHHLPRPAHASQRPTPPSRSPPTRIRDVTSSPVHTNSHTTHDGHHSNRMQSIQYASPPLRPNARPERDHSVSLPPISYERPNMWRESSSMFPPITLPPLTHASSLSPPPTVAQTTTASSSPSSTYPDLADFDAALATMERIRKKAKREHVQALASLSRPFWDIVSRAESVVYGTGAFPPSQ